MTVLFTIWRESWIILCSFSGYLLNEDHAIQVFPFLLQRKWSFYIILIELKYKLFCLPTAPRQSNSPVARAVACTSANWNVPAVMPQTKSHVCLRASLHLLSCFHADLAVQPSEMVLIHRYLFVGGDSVIDIAWEVNLLPWNANMLTVPWSFASKPIVNFAAAQMVLWKKC